MRSNKKIYNSLRLIRSLVLMTLFSCICNKLMAVEEPYINELKGPQVAVNNFFTVADEKFNSGTEWAKIDQNISVNDIITFEINFDTSIFFYNTPFVSTIGFKIYIYGNQSDTSQVTDSSTHSSINLDVKYDTVTGKPYKGIAYYKFKGAHKFKVKILSLVCPQLSPILPIFRLKGQIIIDRQYKFTDVTTDPTQFSIINGNQLKLQWAPSAYAGAEMFDLEYTFIDKHSREGQSIAATQNGDTTFTIPVDSLKKWFKNNCSRITTFNSSHIINLTYDSGYILFRLRGIQVHYGDDVRWEGDWNYYAKKAGTGSCSGTCPSGAALIFGHEQNLNWQFAISFAEEGKQKQVISYFDGSLRNRQSVTINNSDNRSIVQETIYDALGRPAASILPSPANDSTFHYFKGYNINAAYNPYSFTDLVYGTCSTAANSLSDSSGTSRYYSAKNDFKNKYYYAKYIPDAQDFPMAVTEYMPDNTGRIKAQGGVGTTFQLGSGHETKYFYGKPTQTELDRLFGLEAGVATHYLKNMVQDANGQISVSYVDANGKTVATALAGYKPANLFAASNYNEGAVTQVTNDILTGPDFTVNSSDYSLSANATFLAPVTGDYKFRYRVDPLQYSKLYGPNKDSAICSNCYYDLIVTVKNQCDSLLKSDTIVAGNVFDTTCNPLPEPIIDSMTVGIDNIGEYYVGYSLKVSQDALNYFDSVHIVKNSDLKKLNFFLLDELKNTDFTGCYNNCETCKDDLGEKGDFIIKFRSRYIRDSVNFGVDDSTYVASLYDSLYAHCQSIQAGCGVNVCDEKLALLKVDISPGGQYALYDSTYTLLEQPINRLSASFRNQVSYFTDEFGNRDSVILYTEGGEDSVKVDVKDLDDSTFIKNWKDSWADSLVKLHPEYCFYLWCQANSNSYEFDREIENWENADTAIARGWFDPSDYKAILDADPFFNGGNGTALYNQMKDSLRLFSRSMVRISQSDKNILQVIDISLYCNKQYNGWDACNPDSACRSRNREWFMYRQFYLNLKQRFYETARRTSTNPVFANCVNCFIGAELTMACPSVSDFYYQITDGVPAEQQSCYFNSPAIWYNTGLTPNAMEMTVTMITTLGNDTTVTFVFPAHTDRVQLDCLPQLQSYFEGLYAINFEDRVDSLVINGVRCSPLITSLLNPTTTSFTDSTCNTSCPGGIYDPFDRDSVSYYIEYGTQQAGPSSTPSGYTNCTFYAVFDLKKDSVNSCKFFNVWVCEKDSTVTPCANFVCPDSTQFNAIVQTSSSACGSNFAATVYYNGPPIPPGVTVEIPVTFYKGATTVSFTAHFPSLSHPGEHYDDVCTSWPIGTTGIQDYFGGNPVCSGIDTTECPFTGNYPSHCPPESPTDSLYMGKIRRYPEYINPDNFINNAQANNVQEQSAESLQSILDECHANCAAQADIWIQKLRRCTTDPDLLNLLKNRLITVCSIGCSMERPFGASTIPPEINYDYHSLEEAIVGTLGAEALNDSCTQELLSNIYPYDRQPVVIDRLITESDYAICQKLTGYKTQWQTSGYPGSFHSWLSINYPGAYKLDSLELADLLNSCTNCNGILKDDIILPPMLDPNSRPCVNCDSMTVAMAAFTAKFPAIDSTNDDYEELFTNFFNHRFGFSLVFQQYKAFLDSCAYHSGAYQYKLCNQAVTQEDSISSGNNCVNELFANALTNASATYIAYIDSVHKDFRDAWLTKCLNAQPKVTMVADLFEYHYTLYYYDQSGNLVKTVPPEGVTLLSDADIAELQQYRNSSSSYCSNNNAVVFTNGSINYPGGTNAPQLSVGTNPFTIEAWVNLSSYSDQGVISNNHGESTPSVSNQGYSLEILSNKLDFLLGEGATNMVRAQSPNIGGFIPLNTWAHIAVERTSASTVRMFINGNEVPVTYAVNSPGTGNIDNGGTDPFYVGASNQDGSIAKLSTGKLRHVRVYKRALGPVEIRQNFSDYCGNPSNSSDLTFWATLNEGKWNYISGIGYVYDKIYSAAGQASGTIAFDIYGDSTLSPQHKLFTIYRYNSLDQVVKRYTADADTARFLYDRLGRLIISQDKEQKESASYSGTANRFSYTKYDALGRIIEVGEKSDPSSDDIDLLDSTVVKGWMNSGTDRQITKTIYDSPVNLNLQGLSTSRNRVVASVYLENKSDTEGDSTLFNYDINGNVKTVLQHVKALVAVDATNGRKRIDYDYDLVSGKVNHVAYQNGKGDQFYYKYQYDAENRVVRSYSSRDKLIWIEDAAYNYYLHGPLARKEMGQFKVQGVDYGYTLQGWMKGMNSDSLNAGLDMGGDGLSGSIFSRVSRDVSGYKIGYYEGDYVPIGGSSAKAFTQHEYDAPSSLGTSGNELFNGNINSVNIALSKIASSATKGYSYGYDQLNRLVSMDFHTNLGTGTWGSSSIVNDYQERVSYDANGNIKTYTRNGYGGSTNMDQLTYRYKLNTNKLDHVDDNVGSTSGYDDIEDQDTVNYKYDLIGNLIHDQSEGLDTVRWNFYGKINRVVKNSGAIVIDYGYDPSGNRTTKKVNINDTITTTFYVRDAQGNVLGIYSKVDAEGLKWNEQHLYGSIRLGMWKWDTLIPTSPPVVGAGTSLYDSLLLGSRQYELANHLQNIISVISDKKIGNDSSSVVNYYVAEVLAQNDYYPFGMLMPGRKYNFTGAYRYGFNGKENDNDVKGEGDQQDYGMRIYDPRIGRFLSIDPLTKNYPYYTPYQFAGNKPIRFIDLDGLEEAQPQGDWYRGQEGKQITYKYAQGRDKQQLDPKKWWKIPEASRERIVTFGSSFAPTEVQSSIDLHADGTFTVLKSDIREGSVDGHIKWQMTLPNGGYLNVEARDYMQDKAVGDGAFWEAAAAIGGEQALKLGGKVLSKVITKGGGGNYVYRALTTADAENLAAGRGIFAKAPEGSWTLEEHLIHGSSPKAAANNPWIATSSDINIAKSFSSGNGLIRIDLSKVPASSIERGWLNLSRSSAGYHYSIWQQEVSIFGSVPQNAIKVIKK